MTGLRTIAITGLQILVVLLFSLLGTGSASGDEPADLKRELEKQKALIQQQQEILNDLQAKLGDLEASGSPPAGLGPQFGLNLGVFGDVNFSTAKRDEDHHAFSLGNLDLYSSATFKNRLTFLVELVLELEEGEVEIDPERLWVGYTFSDFFILRAGRQHSALGYWNKTYHHGRQLFLTVDRPFILSFEHDGGILPLHTVGIELEGSFGFSGTRWKYEFNLGNGPRLDPVERALKPNNTSDNNNSKQWALRLSARPERLPGLILGLSATQYQVDTSAKPDLLQSVYGSDLSYHGHGVEFIAEYFRLRNFQNHADAFYIQLGYIIYEVLTPYLRYEFLNLNPADPYFGDLQNDTDRTQQIAGFKYDIDFLTSSVKLQYRRDDLKGSKTYHVMETQWAFSF